MATHTLADKVVLIAGGAKNLGGLIPRDLASPGAKAVAIPHTTAASHAQVQALVASGRADAAAAPTLPRAPPAARARAQLSARPT